jgi:hypothetical protein
VKGRCPRPLDDGDHVGWSDIGGARRDRTADLLHAMQALSQLSYSPAALPTANRARILAAYPCLSIEKTGQIQRTNLFS